MIKRSIPFGYMMVRGEIVINEPEAADVRRAFALYLQGASLRDIAGMMTVPYNEGAGWDKHKVKRILDNPKYIGAGGYQPLVEESDFLAAGRLKANKNTGTPLPCPQDIQALKAASFCYDCGGRFVRKAERTVRWKCANSECDNKTLLSDEGIKSSVIMLLNNIIKDPGVLQVKKSPNREPLAVIKLQNEINREMSRAKPDAGIAKSLLLSLAAEKYAGCADTHSILALRAVFEGHKPADYFECELFDVAASKVLVAGNGNISIRLKTGQTLPTD